MAYYSDCAGFETAEAGMPAHAGIDYDSKKYNSHCCCVCCSICMDMTRDEAEHNDFGVEETYAVVDSSAACNLGMREGSPGWESAQKRKSRWVMNSNYVKRGWCEDVQVEEVMW